MYLINKEENNISKIIEKRFGELGFKERDHLQEWVAKNSSCLGEELLIIQKEFSGFDDTNERLDLLAIDKEGNLVIIENKLDDSGKDVVWQALKYASYCSSLTKNNIIKIFQDYLDKQGLNENASENFAEFFDGRDVEEIELNKDQSQRIFLIAANFRKEVTSTALWLMEYNVRVKCFKVTPFQLGESLLLNVEQIIPMKDSEDYIIRMAEKTQENLVTREKMRTSYKVRFEFWKMLLEKARTKFDLFNNISPGKDSWLSAGTGVSGVGFNFVVAKSYGRVEVYISRSSAVENKFIYDNLLVQKENIEKELGFNLEWERLDDKQASRIKYQLNDVSLYNKEDWEKMMNFMITSMISIEKVFRSKLAKINIKLKSKIIE